MSISEVSVDQLQDALGAGARLVDVRETDEYLDGHVPGAVHVPLGIVADSVEAFRGEGPVYIVCRSGARSMRACELLVDEGVDVINVAGGTMAWIASGKSVVIGADPA